MADRGLQTIVPKAIKVRLSQLAVTHFGSLKLLHVKIVEDFIACAPWAADPPLEWQNTGASRTTPGCVVANIMLPEYKATEVQDLVTDLKANGHDVTLTSFLYTAIYWYLMFVMKLD